MSEQTPVQMFRRQMRKKRYKRGPFFLKIAVLILFLLVPFLFPSFQMLDLALKIMIFAALTASFDILLGYTGILSFGHVMFFGIGSYAVALLVGKYGDPTYLNLLLGFVAAMGITVVLAVLISFISLRVKAIFFAMVTLAIAEFAIILATKFSGFTGGQDGVIMSMPGVFNLSFTAGKFMGLDITGRIVTYYTIFLVCLGLFLAMIRFIDSPLGRVLQAIRDNEPRAQAVGYQTFIFKTVSICFGCLAAAVVGGLYVMWVRYANPESVLGIPIMLDVLLMVIIGGMGTLYGALAGAFFLRITHTFLPNLHDFTKTLLPNAHWLQAVTGRWLLILGTLFILVVFFFPKGIVGSIQAYLDQRNRIRA